MMLHRFLPAAAPFGPLPPAARDTRTITSAYKKFVSTFSLLAFQMPTYDTPTHVNPQHTIER